METSSLHLGGNDNTICFTQLSALNKGPVCKVPAVGSVIMAASTSVVVVMVIVRVGCTWKEKGVVLHNLTDAVFISVSVIINSKSESNILESFRQKYLSVSNRTLTHITGDICGS